MAEPAFKGSVLKELKNVVREEQKTFTMNGRKFVLRYFFYKDERWVRCSPTHGFVPMFCGPVRWVLDKENNGI